MDHPTNLGPRQWGEARGAAEMIHARVLGVRKYIRDGSGYAFIHNDEDAAQQLRSAIEESENLIALLGRGTKKKRK